MSAPTLPVLARGALAGLAGTVVQTVMGKMEDVLFLPPWENADMAPRLVHRLGRDMGVDLHEPAKWVLGTAFHFGYGLFWGMSYAALRERRPVDPLLGGALLGGFIYAITFPRWGGAVQTQTERPPEIRTHRMEVVAASVCLGFGVATALANEWLREQVG
jgi:hypothetical protein